MYCWLVVAAGEKWARMRVLRTACPRYVLRRRSERRRARVSEARARGRRGQGHAKAAYMTELSWGCVRYLGFAYELCR